MNMSGESLLVIIIVGVLAGWLAGQIVRGSGFGLVGDLAIGIVGAFIGSWLLPQVGVRLGAGMVNAVVNATIGAILLLLILRVLNGARTRRGWGGGWR
ncbi:MAG: Transglycosylase-associated protein [Hyphomicrobiales bacterium]|nr:Transglycosylase-associated protein [Hyphomicrobiales bacterium]